MAIGWRGQYYRYKDYFLDVVTLYKQRRDVRAFLELILSLSTIIIFVLFALKPTALTIVTLYNQIKDKRNTLDALNQKIKNLQTANNLFNQSRNFIPDVDAIIPVIPEPDTVSKQILGLATKDSVNLLGVSVGQVMLAGKDTTPKTSSDVRPLPEGSMAMPVSISVRGSYSNLLAFIKDLESLRIPVKLDTLSINSSQTQEGSIIVSVITTRIPYLGAK